MKKIVALFLSLLMVFSLTTATFAEAKPITIRVDDAELNFGSADLLIENGTVLATARPLFEALDLNFYWEQQTGELTVTKDGTTVSLRINESVAEWNGEPQELLVPARSVEGLTYVPVRFISEAYGYEVDWISAERTVVIYSDPKFEAEQKASRGFLWEIENEGNTVYLLGSIHIGDSSLYPLAPVIEQAFANSDNITFEIDLSRAAEPEIAQLMMEMSTYTDGTRLPDHISAETYAKLGTFLEEKGMSTDAVDGLKPWFVASSLENMSMAAEGYRADLGIEMHFLQQALEREIPVLELETYESQLSVFNDVSVEFQEKMIVDAILSYGNSGLDELIEMWIEGSDEDLLAMISEMEENEEYYKAMLTNRNIPMTEIIEGYLQGEEKGTYFVVIGAGHMLGPDGVVTLLQEKGYTAVRQ